MNDSTTLGGEKRTISYKQFIKRMAWLPTISLDGTIATLKSGRRYLMRPDGWRRIGGKENQK